MLATVSDITTRLGRPYSSPEEEAQVAAWLEDVEALILERIPDIEAAIIAGSPSYQTVTAVVSAAVIRKINNPTGKMQERIDDYSYGLTSTAANADLSLTDAEWSRLMPSVSSGAFSVRPFSEPDAVVWPW